MGTAFGKNKAAEIIQAAFATKKEFEDRIHVCHEKYNVEFRGELRMFMLHFLEDSVLCTFRKGP